jgi:hypothetical protein
MVEFGWNPLDLGFYMSLTTESRFSTSPQFKNIFGKLCLVPVGDTGTIRTVCAQPSQAHMATAGRVQAMVVRCGSSTSGLWDGPVIYNEIRLVCGTEQSGEGRQAEMYSLFYLCSIFTLFVENVRLMKIMKIILCIKDKINDR